MDVYRISPDDEQPPEQLTHHNGWVSDPAPLDSNVVLYVARAEDGTGPWLYALDIDRRTTHRVGEGTTHYTTVSASLDGRRIVVSSGSQTASLWSVPILETGEASEKDISRIPLQTERALAPRYAGATLYYLSSLAGNDGLWSNRGGNPVEIWRGSDGMLLEPAGISPDGTRIAILLRKQGKVRLHTVNEKGSDLKAIADTLDARGAPSWSPDGKWIIVGGIAAEGRDRKPGLFKIPAEGGTPVRLWDKAAFNPVWSPDGALIAFVGPVVGRLQTLFFITPDGREVPIGDLSVRYEGQRMRFLPNGNSLILMQSRLPMQDFYLLDLKTKNTRQLTSFTNPAAMMTFDITPDGKHIVFDRIKDNTDIVLIERGKA